MNKSNMVIGVVAALMLGGCSTSPTVPASEPHGIVAMQTFQSGTADRLYPVIITEIDGVTITSYERTAYWLAPGKHKIKVIAYISRSREPTLTRAHPDPRRTGYPAYEIELDVKEGTRYLISAKVKGPTVTDWEPVVSSVTEF